MVEREEGAIEKPNYEVVVSIKNEKYFCRIRELSLVGKGDDLQSSYQELMRKMEELFEELEEFGDEEGLVPPAVNWSRGGGGGPRNISLTQDDFKDFLVKAGAVGVMVLVVLYIATQTIGGKIVDVVDSSLEKGGGRLESTLSSSLNTVDKSLERMVKNVRKEIETIIPSKPGREIENELYKAVDHPIDSEREQRIIQSIRVVVKRMMPFAKEFRPLIEEFGIAEKRN